VWNADKGTETLSIKGITGGGTSGAFSPDGKRILSGRGDKKRMVKGGEAGKGTEMLSHKDGDGAVGVRPDGKRILSGVVIRDADTGAELLTLKAHGVHIVGLGVESVAFSPDGKRIVSGSKDCTVRVWDADTGTETLCLTRHKGRVESVAFS